jgi:hypothetical protein
MVYSKKQPTGRRKWSSLVQRHFNIGYIYTNFFPTFAAAKSAASMPPKFSVLIRQTPLQVIKDA